MLLDLTSYRKTFFDEVVDHTAALEGALLRLDAGATDRAAVDEAFRAAHSIKGGADAVGLPHISKYTHSVEGLLERFRADGRIPRRVLDLLLEATDMFARLVTAARADGPPPPGADELLARLTSTAETVTCVTQSAGTSYAVTVIPHRDALRAGPDPLVLLGELARLGTVSRVVLNARALPALGDLDPEQCYLSWTVHLETRQSEKAIGNIFACSPDHVRVSIVPSEPPRPSPPTAAPTATVSGAEPIAGSLVASLERRMPVPDPVRFAAFLVTRGAVTAERALEALVRQRDARPVTPLVAVRAKLLTVEQLKNMLDQMRPDEVFGEAAVRLGYLTANDLGGVLLRQEQSAPPLRDCLLAGGALTAQTLDRELAAYRTKAAASPAAAQSYCDVPIPELPAAPDSALLDENGALLGDFCGEADEHLEVADRNLLLIEADPTNAEAISAVYRGFHTIKGVSSMLGLSAVQMIAHEAESLLNLARDGKMRLQGKPMDLVFASTDALKRQVCFIREWAVSRGKLQEDPALPALVARLRAAVGGGTAHAHTPTASRVAPSAPPAGAPVAASAPVPAEPGDAPAAPKAEAPADHARSARRVAEKETVRVDKDRLDRLINTIGELVIAQSMAQQEFDELNSGSGALSAALPELSKISRDLQELGLSLRMVPLQGTFQKMARLVRDLSRKMDKPVEFALHGEETELDKTVVDQLGDPLMHMVRNAIDHGLEDPVERAAAGKPTVGRVALRAYHQGGSVFIELTDDGKGLDRDRILSKAVEKGIVAEGQRLSDPEIYALIFEAGFSTAKAVTDVSGRGVGMDVVRRNVEALQGNIIIRTQLGQGTTFTIRLPLTLAIMDGLVVGLGDEVYVLPLLAVIESFRPHPADVHRVAGRGETVTARGDVVPLLRLHALLGRPSRVTDPCKGLVVLVEDQGKKYALLVDELQGQMQAVVKSLDANYHRVEGLAGATILGDGRVAMILDIHGLAQLHAQFSRGAPEPALAPGGSDNYFGDAL